MDVLLLRRVEIVTSQFCKCGNWCGERLWFNHSDREVGEITTSIVWTPPCLDPGQLPLQTQKAWLSGKSVEESL